MRTPLFLVVGQGDTDAVTDALLHRPGTLAVEHRFDGHVVRRRLLALQHGDLVTSETPLELAHGCVACTVRDDLLVLLRKLHRRADVHRIVVHLEPWLEPEPICFAVNHVRVHVGPGFTDGPAARDVEIMGVVTCVDSTAWLPGALGDDELADGRTVAQVVVGQAEFADALVLDAPEPTTLEVLRRLAPRARITVGPARIEHTLNHLEPRARRGRGDDPHGPLLAGQPPLTTAGPVGLVEFAAHRPFHPQRLHDTLDVLLDGVVRTRGRLWLAGRSDHAMYLESAGGGLRVSSAGKWLAAMTSRERAYVDPERRAMADLRWHPVHGDRHTSLTMLLCGARPMEIEGALRAALLDDAEMSRPGTWPGFPNPFGDWHEDPCDHALADQTTDGTSHRGDHR